MALVNMTEIIVKERLEELLKEYDCCKCENMFYGYARSGSQSNKTTVCKHEKRRTLKEN